MILRRGRGWFRSALLAACLSSPALHAEYQHRVVVIDARDTDDATTLELLARVRGELGAAGFDVVLLPVSGELDPRVAVETLGRDLAPAAVLSVRHSRGAAPGESVAEMWVSDRLSSRTLMQRVAFDDRETSTQTARLAVQVAELLKARLALLWVDPAASSWTPLPAPPLTRTAPPPPPPPAEPDAAEPDDSSAHSQLTVGAGLGLLHNFKGGFGSAWAPLLRVGFGPSSLSNGVFALELRVTGAVSPDSSKLSWGPGSARIRQGFVLAEALGRFLPAATVQPVISLGNGAYTVAASGEAEPPFSTNAATTWSGLSALGAGLRIQPSRSIAWIVEGQVLASWSKTSLAIADRTIGSVGLPMAFVSTSVVGIY
jgi:hypothetical protein